MPYGERKLMPVSIHHCERTALIHMVNEAESGKFHVTWRVRGAHSVALPVRQAKALSAGEP